jgi:hypothetical protein
MARRGKVDVRNVAAVLYVSIKKKNRSVKNVEVYICIFTYMYIYIYVYIYI